MSQLPLFDHNAPLVVAPKKPRLAHTLPSTLTRPPVSLAPDAQWRHYKADTLHIGYVLLRRRRKTIGLQVSENGLRISAPSWATYAQIDQAITQKSDWILRKLHEWNERKAKLSLAQSQWCDGGRIPYLGVQITLKLRPSERETIFDGTLLEPSTNDVLSLPLDPEVSSDRIQDATHAWLQQQAKWYFEQRLLHFVARSSKTLSRWRLASPAKRWGSCSSDGAIMLNWRLIHFNKSIIDYVIAHEVAHLKEMNHSSAFWLEVERLMPNFATIRQQLRAHDPGSLPLL